MKMVTSTKHCAAALACVSLFNSAAHAHSASNAYLTISVDSHDSLLHAQWDVALRDLEFVLGLNAKGDGKLTWGELLNRKSAVSHYVYSHLDLREEGKACGIEPRSMQVDDHADGAYVVLFFDFRCGNKLPTGISLDYSLFFDIDPTHRGIFVLHNGPLVSTALFAPDKQHIQLPLKP
ncbi:MAG: hypothetical protein M3O26_09695 [Pseudomonadota bacterium]|nr:hypothetical protein [Pseudomonadota bacterium]